MNREKRKRRLQVKCQLERLETRWLMRASPALMAAAQPLEVMHGHAEVQAEILARRLSTQVEQWVIHHPSAAAPLDLKEQKAELEQFVPANMAPWGTLRVLARLEAQGDHRFDLVYQQISVRFDHWAARHPVQARLSGITAAPLAPEKPTGKTPATTSSGAQAGSGGGSLAGPIGVHPDGGPPPPLNFPNYADTTSFARTVQLPGCELVAAAQRRAGGCPRARLGRRGSERRRRQRQHGIRRTNRWGERRHGLVRREQRWQRPHAELHSPEFRR